MHPSRKPALEKRPLQERTRRRRNRREVRCQILAPSFSLMKYLAVWGAWNKLALMVDWCLWLLVVTANVVWRSSRNKEAVKNNYTSRGSMVPVWEVGGRLSLTITVQHKDISCDRFKIKASLYGQQEELSLARSSKRIARFSGRCPKSWVVPVGVTTLQTVDWSKNRHSHKTIFRFVSLTWQTNHRFAIFLHVC